MGAPDADTTPVEVFVAPDFWTELSSAFAGPKDGLENTDDVGDASGSIDDQFLQSDTSYGSLEPHRLLFGDTSLGHTTFNLSPALKDHLLNVYKERVDCIFKPLHWPSSLAAIQEQGLKYQDKTEKAVIRALEYALYFTSACTLFDYELDQRQEIVDALRQECENGLVRAGLLATTSCRLLQAFVRYLVSPVILYTLNQC